MNVWKRIGKALLFPHLVVMLVLLPVATVLLVYSMVFLGTDSVVAYASYALSAYTLTVWCVKTPGLIRAIRAFKEENKLAKRWFDDARWRMNISLYGSLLWNVAYAVFQLGLGFYHASFWFHSLAAYYLCLAMMRFFLVRYTRTNEPGVQMQVELRKYRVCGWIFLGMNLALTGIVFFMVYWNRTFVHHQITTIAMAAYTFTSFTMAIIGMVKYKKYSSPVFSASKAISFAAACVSMLTLESTMLTTFEDGTMGEATRRLFLGGTGAMILVVVLAMAIYMIVQSSKKLKNLSENETA